MKKFLFLSLFPLFAFSGNLNELLNLAEQNKQVEASRYSLEASKEKEYATKSAYLPNLTLGATQTFNQESNMFAAEKDTTGTATLAFTIYDGGKREASFEQQQALVKSATFSLASVQNNISLDVIYYYYNYLSTLANKESTLKKMEQLEAERNRLEKFLSVGAITADELQKIVSSIEQTKVDLLTLDNTLNNISNTLEYLTGEQVSVEKGSTIIYKENTNNEENKRLDILALEESVQSNKSEIKMAKSPNLPTIALQNTYSKHDFDYPVATENLKEQNSVQLSMQWKIFDFASTSSNAQAAYLNYLSKNSELSYAKYKAKASFKNAQNSYKTSLAKIEAAKAKLQASEMTYELVKKKFQQGIVNNVSYLDALSDKFNSNSQLQTALNEVEYQKAVLLYEMGENIKGAIQ
ncbi:MAG TPA: TolC family protein [Aliarcobacter sp.]|uniref:TolC family protein n=1 Tax=Aliarcobacter butzleri TaxID=28197 RepID=A0AAW7Q0Q9_9BACT|nr:TolC family protein [Aliarcobacter butzleri]MBP7226893.1 TolC family protein [Aliarcobacter sp.]MDN5071777.1 TolC family protein [Aliarcobacter butzleri]HRL07821.1 TolC family protein [Aliarcobacter sp.]HRL07828.1 TolC family protein [Aliarcobacter sp.]